MAKKYTVSAMTISSRNIMIVMRKLPVKYILKVENLIADQLLVSADICYPIIFSYPLLENQFHFHVSATLAGT